ncbi:hypothetical protein BLOT_006345 [Blomia tropicalis]|nr:hypothetical protein BLOT_006345 [Blomia tropicalis]
MISFKSRVLTACFVVQRCYLYRQFIKPRIAKKNPSFNILYPNHKQLNPESQHFHLSIVPVYGSEMATKSLASSPTKLNNQRHKSDQLNQYENLTQLAEKTRIRYSSLKPDDPKLLPIFPKVRAMIRYESMDSNGSTFRLHLKIVGVTDLKMKEYMVEPSCYVTVVLVGFKSGLRKSIINKVTQSEIFRTETVKKSLTPQFTKSTFVTEQLPKSLLKEGCIKLRVVDEERNANEICLGEVMIPLKKIEPLVPTAIMADQDQTKSDVESQSEADLCRYTLFPMKEVKGELFVGFCYLPTSKRVNITIVKANLRHSPAQSGNSPLHQAFYTRILMFNNGKLIKKKKTAQSVRLVWGENETLSFDLNDDDVPYHQISFMLVLSSKMQNSLSPSSPESPQTPPDECKSLDQSTPPKDRHIGHFILDRDIWLEEIIKRPRKQILKWFKLF